MPAREYRWRHLALLISILLLFVVAPLVIPLHHGILVMNVISAAVLVAGSYALSERKYLFAIAIVLSAITIVGTGLLLAFPQPRALLVSHSSIVVLVAFFCVTILSYVLGSRSGHSDKIFAAICVYMLLGYGWTFVYSLLLELQPQSFAATSEVARNDYVGRILQLRFFSVVTLTAVGYGDFVPRSPVARTMTIVEAVMGQFYLVALIGRLVGLHIVHGSDPRSCASLSRRRKPGRG
jgi:voltage-gated potassium channel